ncbi:MAG: hypothetical protein FWE69_02945 [Clostridiales bacterium]|nr:hypothetical protein [Clostridiales bacterium]
MKEPTPKTLFTVPALPGAGAGKSTGGNTGGSTGGSTGASGGGNASNPSAKAAPQAPAVSFDLILEQMLAAYEPALVDYAPRSEQTVAGEIATWLRPAYDAAIEQRADQTLTHNANLDADAIARGMGTSTYVTDVKSRNYRQETDDVRLMESDYSAKLSLYLFNAMEADRARGVEVATFNASEQNKARAQAYDAAFALYRQTLDQAAGTSKGGKSSSAGGGSLLNSILAAGANRNAVSAVTGLTYIGSLTPAQQNQLFNSGSSVTAATRNEVIRAIGAANFTTLQKQFNAK